MISDDDDDDGDGDGDDIQWLWVTAQHQVLELQLPLLADLGQGPSHKACSPDILFPIDLNDIGQQMSTNGML